MRTAYIIMYSTVNTQCNQPFELCKRTSETTGKTFPFSHTNNKVQYVERRKIAAG